MKNIGIDIDGVIVDTVEVYLEYIHRVTGQRFKQEEITEYFFEDCLNVSKEQVAKAVKEMFEDDIWDEIPFYEGALEALKKIGKMHNLYIITSRPALAKNTTVAWIKKHKIPSKKTIFTDMDSKLSYIKEHNIKLDFFIEDRLEFALEVSKVGTKVFLMDRPWNRNHKDSNGLIRVKDWAEISEKLFLKP